MSYKTEFPLVKHIFDTDERLMIVLFFTGSIGESACVREHSSSWGAVIGQGNKVDKRISHKQKHKFQVKREKKGPFHVAQMHAVCLYMSLRKTI